MRVLLLGATGTIGRATLPALVAEGHRVMVYARPGADPGALTQGRAEVVSRPGTFAPADLADAMWGAEAVVSCLGPRTAAPADAWAVNHDIQAAALEAAMSAGAAHFVFLSAISVQKPRLAYQKAKRAFEDRLRAAQIRWTVVRPTVCFGTLPDQLDRLRAGRRFRVSGDGRGTACKPISEHDLGRYLALCLTDRTKQNRILPIGGPGPALTPREIGAELFRLLGRPPRFREAPPAMMDMAVGGLSAFGRIAPRMRDLAEQARIARYHARESALLWDPARQRYDAAATPEFGTRTLFDHLARRVAGKTGQGRSVAAPR